jgi:regulator of sigma E protease
MGFTNFIHFLGLLSINLAVINFLPVPPLDGGQMVFLAAEKVRGRPLPESALRAGTYAGLALVLCLMAFVLWKDVVREWTGKFF